MLSRPRPQSNSHPRSRRTLRIGWFGVAIATVVLLGSIALTSTQAASLLSYRLTNQSSEPISTIDFRVIPPGSITPRIVGNDPNTGMPLTSSPLTVLDDSTGFDPEKFSVALGQADGVQGLRLLFGQNQVLGPDGEVVLEPILDGDGNQVGLFNPGGVLNFAVNVESDDPKDVSLNLPPDATGLFLEPIAASDPVVTPPDNNPEPDPNSNGGNVPTPQVPEPATLGLWSGLLVAGFCYRRRKGGRSLDRQ